MFPEIPRPVPAALLSILACLALAVPGLAAKPKTHSVSLGSAKQVPYSARTDPSGALPDEQTLRVRPLLVDDAVKEWTTGDMHAVTERSFAVRRALRLNDALPGDKNEHWIWQRGPWLLVDRATGHYAALKLPEYDPSVSRVVWYRDYAAYCGLSGSGKQLFAVVAQLGARRPVLSRKLAAWTPGGSEACAPAAWQRDPLRVSFQRIGEASVSYDLVGTSAVLVEDGDSEPEGEAKAAPGTTGTQ